MPHLELNTVCQVWLDALSETTTHPLIFLKHYTSSNVL